MLLYLTVFILVALGQSATVAYSDIPKVNPLYSNVSASSSYSMNTLLPFALTSQSYFILNFSSSSIITPTSTLNCSYLNQTSQTYASFTSTSLVIQIVHVQMDNVY